MRLRSEVFHIMATAVDLTNPIFHDETAARQHLESLLWPFGPVCPHCGVIDQATLMKGKSTRPGLYKCRACRKPFSAPPGTATSNCAAFVPFNVPVT